MIKVLDDSLNKVDRLDDLDLAQLNYNEIRRRLDDNESEIQLREKK